MGELTKSEIVHLFYGDTIQVSEPNDDWKLQAEILGLNPEDFVVELTTMEVINIYELYNALTLSEVEDVKDTLDFYKSKIYGNLELSMFMIAPKNFEFYGEPKNRNISYYIKKFSKASWAEKKFIHYAKQFSLGDTIQPLNTEELIHQYSESNPIIIDEKTLAKITEAELTIHEWERTMIIKELISSQAPLKEAIPNNNLITITDKMPRKFMYGQAIIYNKNTDKYFKDNKWILAPK
tara:strand:- start:977 stop:1687 length:711 start_codon:yes stop_codon:yes gene_type:complete